MTTWQEYPRTYLKASFGPTTWSEIEPVLSELLSREVPDLKSLNEWMQDWSEVEDALDEYRVLREIAKDQNTRDEEIRRDYLQWKEQIEPKIKPFFAAFQKKVVNHPQVGELPQDCAQFLKRFRSQVSIFNPKNVDLEAKCDKLVAEFYKVRNAQEATCDYQNPNREQREATFAKMVKRQSDDYDSLDSVLDSMLELRLQIARNAGFENFLEFRWRQLNRFDYTPEDCLKFVGAVEDQIVPYLLEIDVRRAKTMGLKSLRPCDLRVDAEKGDPLRPYETPEELLECMRKVVGSICPDLMRDLDFIVDRGQMDLERRPDKANFVGYCQFLRERRSGFIFYNPKSVHRDIESIAHEFGHVCHIHACRDEPLTWNRQVPLEFAEAVANGIQLISGRFWKGTFYDQVDARRARIAQLEGIVDNLVYTARGEAFLHWLHVNPGHTSEQRKQAWLDFDRRIGHDFDWSGLEKYQPYTWVYEIPHLFFAPFYWIEYLFGQVGALQLSQRFTQNPELTMNQLCQAMALGNTVPVTELFRLAGISLWITPQLLEDLVGFIDKELASLQSGTIKR